MGKIKKGKKLDYEEDADDHIENEKTTDDDVTTKTKKKEKKVRESPAVESDSEGETVKRKGSKKQHKDSVDSTTDSLKELSISSKPSKKDKKKGKGGGSDNEEEVSLTKTKKKGKKGADDDSDEEVGGGGGARSGFAALALSDDDDQQTAPPANLQSDDESDKPAPQTKQDAAKKGGKKGKKKKKDDDDEDLDQILAELEMEYSGQAPPPKPEQPVPSSEEPAEQPAEQQEVSKKSKKKEKKKEEKKTEEDKEDKVGEGDAVQGAEDDEDSKTMKTAAQKRKEKKERDKQKRITETKIVKAKEGSSEPGAGDDKTEEPTQAPEDKGADDQEADDDDDKKKKKKKKGKEEKEKDKKGMPNKKVVAAMQEHLKKIKEEEERLKKEEEERLKKEEEAEQLRQEQLRLEQERKEKKKAKEKERKERLKAEGKLLTAKQKADKARAEAMIEAMKAMYGAAAVLPGTKPASAKTPQKKKKEETASNKTEAEAKDDKDRKVSETESTPPPDTTSDDVKDSWEDTDDVKDAWDADSGEEDNKQQEEAGSAEDRVVEKKVQIEVKERNGPVHEKAGESDEGDSDESSNESDGSESDESDDHDHQEKKSDAEKKREKAVARIKARQENAEKSMTLDELRAAVVCVLGHVDTGKTKILDKLRRTNVQDGEAGGITQQIGATNVPIDAIKEQTKHVKGFSQMELRIPGLLIIDTPGHESFSNLRSRGSSLCDIAILVVDIMHGLEPQTIESLNLLKQRKTPFIVALNKIDRLYDWQTMNRKDVRDIIKSQASNTQLEFEQRAKEVILQFAEQGMNAVLFYENKDPRSYVSLVPTSAITGEGMGNLLGLIIESCQNHLAKRLMFSQELQATVLEVKAIPGLGTTIDVILVNGYLREGDTVVLAGTEAPIVTQIRSLLMPQPLKELRVKNAYVEFKEIKAAQGVKIAAKDLEKVIAGLNLRVAYKPDEVEILKEEAGRELKSALSSIKLQERGVYVQASTLGSLEALLEFLKTSSIPYANIRIGPVVKKDVMKASTMLEHDSQYATILAFDVKIERDAQELADSLGVKIFQADIIYHLFDRFMAYREELKRKKREEFKSIAVFPCKLRILPQFVFNSRDPIVMGVIVEAGIVKEGTPICVPSKEFVDIGIVTSLEVNHKNQETARKGQEVCIKIEPIPGEAPKMFGRHFDEKDLLISKISRQSIDACKDYFRDDLVKTDWQLMVELKKLFQIL